MGGRSKQMSRKSTGGMAPRIQLATRMTRAGRMTSAGWMYDDEDYYDDDDYSDGYGSEKKIKLEPQGPENSTTTTNPLGQETTNDINKNGSTSTAKLPGSGSSPQEVNLTDLQKHMRELKDRELQLKEQQLHQKDKELKQKDRELQQKDTELDLMAEMLEIKKKKQASLEESLKIKKQKLNMLK